MSEAVVAIVQARMGSTRFPGKVLAPLGGRPMLARELERVARAETLDAIVVATTTAPVDDAIAKLGERLDVPVHRGSADDVVARFQGAADQAGAGVVVRVTGDCPLLDPAVIDRAVRAYRDASPPVDFVSTALEPRTYPDGMDVEVFSRATLDRVAAGAGDPADREHVTSWIVSSGALRLLPLHLDRQAGHIRITVDFEADLALVRELFDRLYPQDPAFGLDAILAELPRIQG